MPYCQYCKIALLHYGGDHSSPQCETCAGLVTSRRLYSLQYLGQLPLANHVHSQELCGHEL